MVTSSTENNLHLDQTKQKLSIQSSEFTGDTTAIRSLDWKRSRFDIEFGLRNGTTYNSFIIEGEKIALIDTSHEKFKDLWVKETFSKIDPQSIDFLIVSHTEPDHSGLIGDLLNLNENIIIVGSKIALKFLENQLHKPFKSLAVKTGDKLPLGINISSQINHEIEFISAPNLHWPDTIFSFDQGTQVLYTCDAFGLHYCSNNLFDIDEKEILPDFEFYYDCLMGPNARSVIQAIKKMDKLPEIKTIAVGHGPLLHYQVKFWKDKYFEWSNQRNAGNEYIAVCYISQYGYCDKLSQSLAHGIGKANAQCQLIDLRSSDPQELSALISEAKGIVIPTWPNEVDEDLQQSIGTILAAMKEKQMNVVYDSYGGNDEPIDSLASKFRELGQKQVLSPLRVKESPDENTFQKFEEAGTDLGQMLNRKKNMEAIKKLDNNMDQALGRLSGGLYVVTAKNGEGKNLKKSAMVASWVSQASFEPPGLTVAVAKDRAIESFLQVGNYFVINVLEENNYQQMFRHFLKRFPPGADRFKDVKISENLAKGGPVLVDSLAFLDCIVESRMETPDHWIIYGIVKNGKISKLDSKTAVHHRKTGNHY
tara:strand:- start:2360 stop:4135 length:1776 start_codon:yes stop_codon:yes gene_type:complete